MPCGVVEQERPQHGVADHSLTVKGREQILPLGAVDRAERTQELPKHPEGRLRPAEELGAPVDVVEVAHHRVVGQGRLVEFADVHEARGYGGGEVGRNGFTRRRLPARHGIWQAEADMRSFYNDVMAKLADAGAQRGEPTISPVWVFARPQSLHQTAASATAAMRETRRLGGWCVFPTVTHPHPPRSCSRTHLSASDRAPSGLLSYKWSQARPLAARSRTLLPSVGRAAQGPGKVGGLGV